MNVEKTMTPTPKEWLDSMIPAREMMEETSWQEVVLTVDDVRKRDKAIRLQIQNFLEKLTKETSELVSIMMRNHREQDGILIALNRVKKFIENQENDENDENLIKLWQQKVYQDKDIKESEESYCFESLALGFFMAHGKSEEEAGKLYQKCVELGCY